MVSSPINVCLLNDSFPPLIDGVANTVLNYADIITKKYGNAVVAVPQYPGVTDRYPFPVVRYPSINTTRLVGYRAGYPFSPSALRSLETQNIGIIHSHCPIASTYLARMLRETIDVPIVFTYHTKFDIDIARAIRSEHLQQAAIRLIVNNVEACDEVWVVSRGAGENLKSLGYEGDYIVMENGVDFPRGRVGEEETSRLRGRYGIPDDVPVFLFVGRMMWYKGIRIILDGLKKAEENGGRQFRMIFVGDGADRAEMEAYARRIGIYSSCIFTGAILDREILRAYFCASDLFLFPSTFDTNGIVVREAAACGLASVLISGSSAAEGITDGYTGILIGEDAASMAEAIDAACRNRERMKDIGRHAMEEIYISWEESVAKACDRYGTVIDRYQSQSGRPRVRWDELFSAAADIHGGMEKARSAQNKITDKFKYRVEQVMERFDRYL